MGEQTLAKIYYPVDNILDKDTSAAEHEMRINDKIFPMLIMTEIFNERVKAIAFSARKDMIGDKEFTTMNEWFVADEMIEKGYEKVEEWPTTVEFD